MAVSMVHSLQCRMLFKLKSLKDLCTSDYIHVIKLLLCEVLNMNLGPDVSRDVPISLTDEYMKTLLQGYDMSGT